MFILAAALLFASLGDFKLQSGQVIHDCKLGYRIYGQANSDRSNIILFPTWFNGTTSDLEHYVSATGLADPSKYYIVTVDALSNGVSSSPSNSPTQLNKAFPKITIRDMVETEHMLLTQILGIQHVYAVMGISMGGMQTFQWMAAYPEFMDRAVTIVGTPRMGEKDIVLWSSFLTSMNLKPAASTSEDGTPPAKKSLFSQLLTDAEPMLQTLLTAEAQQQLGQVMQGGNQPGHTPAPSSPDGSPAPPPLPMDKKPEDVLHQFEAMVVHDISKPFGRSLDSAAAAIKAKSLVINSVHDKCVSPELPQDFALKIKAQRFMMTGPCGHNAYKSDCEESEISPVILKFLASR